MKVGIFSLSVGHWDLMYDHMKSIYDNAPPEKEVIIVPNLDYKMSVAGALNKGFDILVSLGCDYIVYVADDVIVADGDIERVVSKLQEGYWLVVTHCAFAFFGIDPIVLKEVGYWDEGFYPAYFEDNDWLYRIRLRDPDKVALAEDTHSNHIGSVTLKRMSPAEQEQHHVNFRRNRDRYIAKWGGEPNHEIYTIPWNGNPPDGYVH